MILCKFSCGKTLPRVWGGPDNVPMHALTPVFVLAVAFLIAGCASLLPSSSNESPSGFATFADARQALEKLVPHQTTLAELAQNGFNPAASSNVTLIPYPEIVGRLIPYPSIQAVDIDPGVRACIAAQSGCRAYLFHFGSESRKREGSFWLDFLNVRRTTKISGWRFDGLVVVDEKRVLFRNFSGEEKIDRTEQQINPLGPFQPAGEAAARSLIN